MFLTGVCLRGTLVILCSAENNRVILSAEVRMRGRQANSSVLAAGAAAATAASSMRQFIPQSCVQTARLSFKIMIRPDCPLARQRLREGQTEAETEGEAAKEKKSKKMMETVTMRESEG